MNVREAPLLRQ